MNRTVSLIIGAAALAVLLLLLTAAGVVPGWLGVLLIGCLIPIGGLIVRSWRPEQLVRMWRSEQPLSPLRVEYESAQAPPPTVQIHDAPLPSADPDYRFLLSCVACWRVRAGGSAPLHAHPEELARLTVIARASQLTVTEQPGDYDLIRHKLDEALAVLIPDRTGTIEIWAQSVSLTLPADDLQRQHDLSAIRKDEQVWEYRRNYERNVRAYLLNEVLPDTGSAVAWWLAQDPKQVRETVGLIGTLAQLSAAANNRDVDPVFQSFINGDARPNGHGTPLQLLDIDAVSASLNGNPTDGSTLDSAHNLVNSLFSPEAEAERALFADRLARLVKICGHGGLAERIRTDFNAPPLDIPGDGDSANPPPNGEAATETQTSRHVKPDNPSAESADGAQAGPRGVRSNLD
jgi:hypothetical protein